MGKKCIICETNEPKYGIKGTNDVYCEKCAVEQFGDIGYLEKIENKIIEPIAVSQIDELEEEHDSEEE